MTRRLLTALLAAAALVALVVPGAAAHDELVSSVPADGYTVTALPAVARFTFEEEARADDLTVRAAGRTLPVAAVTGDAHALTVDLSGVPATETVTLGWRIIDDHDGHVTSGTVVFHVLNHVAEGAVPAPTTTPKALVPGGLVSSVPAQGFTVTRLPGAARLTFAGATSAKELTVKVDGRTLPVKAVAGDPKTLSVGLAGVSATETVELSWRVLRAGAKKPVTGVVAFHVLEHVAGDRDADSDGPAAAATEREQPLRALSVATHLVGYLAMAVLLGGLFFIAVLWPAGARDRRTRLLLGTATAVGLASAVVAVFVATEQVAPLPFREAIAQHFGRVSVALALMWLLATVVVVAVVQQPDSVRRAAWRVGALVVAIGMIRATGMSAHGTQGSHATTGILVDFLHLTAVSAWVGGLAVLTIGLLPRRQLDELAEVVPRFSRVAATSVVLLVATGVVLAWQLIGSVGDLFSTDYGRILILKVVLIGAVLVAATASKRWVDHRLAAVAVDGNGRAVRYFVASVGTEAVLVLAVLGAASVLVTSSPGL